MEKFTNEFNNQGYTYYPKFLNIEDCQIFSNHLFKLQEENKTIQDKQCPLSHAVYGEPLFDELLEKARPFIEKIIGKELLPTYSYARKYTPGEELKNHRDRPSCQISATLTLGYDGNQWPIYMGDREDKKDGKPIFMNPGDIVIYKGMEKFHWREPYKEGKWQTQVFLHYVDKNGPYKDFKYDQRESLGIKSNVDNPYKNFIFYRDAFPKTVCQKIIETYSNPNIERINGFIGGGSNEVYNKDVRHVQKIQLPTYKNLGGRLAAVGLDANYYHYKFDIERCEQAEFLIYPGDGGKYNSHIDTFMIPENKDARKLTVLAFFNNDYEGGKLYLKLGKEKIYPPQEPGTVIVFPSFLLHGVEPVTKGTRFSAVAWMTGPWFK